MQMLFLQNILAWTLSLPNCVGFYAVQFTVWA